MSASAFFHHRFQQLRSIFKWMILVVPMAAVVGSLCALFLLEPRPGDGCTFRLSLADLFDAGRRLPDGVGLPALRSRGGGRATI